MAMEALPGWGMLLAAFAGGAFGAAVGPLQSFTLAGFVVVLGEVYALAHRTLGSAAIPVDITGSVAFGVVLGPHIAFGGGVAAVAYASKQGYLEAEFEYHEAKHIARGLGSRPDVLAVGGVFGIVGYWVATLSATVGLPTDPVALGVVLSALVHRLVLGYDLIGAAPSRWFDMSPFERGEREPRDGTFTTDGGDEQFLVEPWLPYQYRWSHLTGLGAVVGALGGYLAYLTGSAFLAFGISAVALAFLCAGAADIPVTHHMSLPASTVVVASVESTGPRTPAVVAEAMPLGEAVVLGAVFGVIGALVGEVAQRVLYAHADTHLDPPAASIVVTSFLVGLLALSGVLPSSAWIPLG
ncbi:MAG: hypothetical protein ABEH77_02865 [Halobacteriaceae archaeon]